MTQLTALVSTLQQLNGSLRIAFYGRTSNEEKQDPSLSIPRQLDRVAQGAGAVGGTVTERFFDIESGRKALTQRGHGANAAALNVRVRRDGGLHDLLRRADEGAFDLVMVESIDRISRVFADSAEIERRLTKAGVLLLAADEPLGLDKSAILLRRIKMAMAEFFINDLLERSWAGMMESTRQGWHTGGPAPYGYLLEEHPHPNPNKAREGKRKHKLIVDPVRGRVVKQIFHWYCSERRGLGEITRMLNDDHASYPPPEPSNRTIRELPPTWARATVQAMLRNPKYTGFNVWNRHNKHSKGTSGASAKKPKSEWVFSDKPTHEPLVPMELFEKVPEIAAANDNRAKRGGARANLGAQPARSSARIYPLRGRVFCEACGRRLAGTHQKGGNWYRCQFVDSRSPRAAEIAGHPKSLQVKEAPLLDATLDFLSRRVFRPERLELLRDELSEQATGDTRDFTKELESLRAARTKLDKKIDRLWLEIEDTEDRDDPVARRARNRIDQLVSEQALLDARIAEFESDASVTVEAADPEEILSSIPDLSAALATYSAEELRELFEAFDLQVRYDKLTESAEISVALIPELLDCLSPETTRPATEAGQRSRSIAGAGFEPATSGL